MKLIVKYEDILLTSTCFLPRLQRSLVTSDINGLSAEEVGFLSK